MSIAEFTPDRYRTAPQRVEVIEHTRIPLADGTELAARIWLPASAQDVPVPAVLEYLPYRKNDMTAARDLTIHPEFAQAGYASIRVDIRGTGDSTGVMTDEYSETELSDGIEVLAWIGRQDWSNGKVGVIGKSWGGFNGLQLAALQPPELAAIITICSTDDRYADDVHYNGGAIVGDQMLSWASTMWAYSARPQDPAIMGEGWREDWKKRIDGMPVNIEDWLTHQRRDDYWKHASVCEDPAAIQVPVLAVGGLLDEYRTTLFRLMETMTAPVHALLGPWAHNYPHQAMPGPAIDFIAESIRWWDHWMQGADNGVDSQPQVRAYLPESTPVGSDHSTRPGRWVAEQSWPSPAVTPTSHTAAEAVVAGPTTLSSTAPIGYTGGSWLQFGEPAGQALDQAPDDALSWTATWDALEAPLDILGTPQATLTLNSTTDRGVIAVRLCDVSPDGESRLVTMGLFNLTHHASHEHPEPLTPGEDVTVSFPLLSTAHRFAPGHRVRMSVSASFWPLLWPSPRQTDLTVVGDPALEIPVRDPEAPDWQQDEFRAPPARPTMSIDADYAPLQRRLEADLLSGAARMATFTESWQTDRSDGLVYYSSEEDAYRRTAGDPLSAEAQCTRVIRYRRPAPVALVGESGHRALEAADAAPSQDSGWDVELRTVSRMTGDETNFLVTNELVAYINGEPYHRRSTSAHIPRDLT